MFNLYRVILPVHDIERAQEFYGNVFLEEGSRVSPGRHYFNLGGTILALYDPEADGDGMGDGWRHHPLQYVYFAVDDLASTLERVRAAGGKIQDGIAVRPWGEESFYATDPFGNPISFVRAGTEFTGDRTG